MQSSKFALFLGDLSLHCNEADLAQVFSPFGTIQEIRVKRSKETSKTLSYGFLEFSSASAAVNAMNSMDGVVVKGRPLRFVTNKQNMPKDFLQQSPSSHCIIQNSVGCQ